MKRSYDTPIIDIEKFESEDVITTSSLTNGGANGESKKESFSSLFK
ncbi:MAG: hypothetical protein IJ583_08700 [Firmicutes bacterium]|nr:hypothetical protein [Bacillota bacterium]